MPLHAVMVDEIREALDSLSGDKEAFQAFRKAEFAWKHQGILGREIVLEKVLFPFML
jgi:hypothetical protein